MRHIKMNLKTPDAIQTFLRNCSGVVVAVYVSATLVIYTTLKTVQHTSQKSYRFLKIKPMQAFRAAANIRITRGRSAAPDLGKAPPMIPQKSGLAAPVITHGPVPAELDEVLVEEEQYLERVERVYANIFEELESPRAQMLEQSVAQDQLSGVLESILETSCSEITPGYGETNSLGPEDVSEFLSVFLMHAQQQKRQQAFEDELEQAFREDASFSAKGEDLETGLPRDGEICEEDKESNIQVLAEEVVVVEESEDVDETEESFEESFEESTTPMLYDDNKAPVITVSMYETYETPEEPEHFDETHGCGSSDESESQHYDEIDSSCDDFTPPLSPVTSYGGDFEAEEKGTGALDDAGMGLGIGPYSYGSIHQEAAQSKISLVYDDDMNYVDEITPGFESPNLDTVTTKQERTLYVIEEESPLRTETVPRYCDNQAEKLSLPEIKSAVRVRMIPRVRNKAIRTMKSNKQSHKKTNERPKRLPRKSRLSASAKQRYLSKPFW